MLNLSCCLCEQGRHSYSLPLSWYPFRSSLTLPFRSSRALGFHSTNTTPAAHLVLLACSVAKSFAKDSRALVDHIPPALQCTLNPLLVSRHSIQSPTAPSAWTFCSARSHLRCSPVARDGSLSYKLF